MIKQTTSLTLLIVFTLTINFSHAMEDSNADVNQDNDTQITAPVGDGSRLNNLLRAFKNGQLKIEGYEKLIPKKKSEASTVIVMDPHEFIEYQSLIIAWNNRFNEPNRKTAVQEKRDKKETFKIMLKAMSTIEKDIKLNTDAASYTAGDTDFMRYCQREGNLFNIFRRNYKNHRYHYLEMPKGLTREHKDFSQPIQWSDFIAHKASAENALLKVETKLEKFSNLLSYYKNRTRLGFGLMGASLTSLAGLLAYERFVKEIPDPLAISLAAASFLGFCFGITLNLYCSGSQDSTLYKKWKFENRKTRITEMQKFMDGKPDYRTPHVEKGFWTKVIESF